MTGLARRWLPLAAGLAAVSGMACEDGAHRDIHRDLHVITTRDDELAAAAQRRLIARGVTALPQIEIALHTAGPPARLRLVDVLGAVGHPEGAAILRQLALHDGDAPVRTRAEALMRAWAVEASARGAAARAACDLLERKRAAGHGPLVRAQ